MNVVFCNFSVPYIFKKNIPNNIRSENLVNLPASLILNYNV